MKRIEDGWMNFIAEYSSKFGEKFPKTFTLTKRPHSIQRDSNNCGVYCLMFAERHVTGKSMMNIYEEDLQQMRKKVAQELMLYEVFLTDCCPKCGCRVADDDEKMQCHSCKRFYHFKGYCVEEDLAELAAIGDSAFFICRLCRINFWPLSVLMKGRTSKTESHGSSSVTFSSTSEMIKRLHKMEKVADDVIVTEITNDEPVPSKCKPLEKEKKWPAYNLRKNTKKCKRSSFVYAPLQVKERTKHCMCQKPNDGRIYWQCEACTKWFHPHCLGMSENEEPPKFYCPSCLSEKSKQKAVKLRRPRISKKSGNEYGQFAAENAEKHISHVSDSCDTDGEECRNYIPWKFCQENIKSVKGHIMGIMICEDNKCCETDHKKHICTIIQRRMRDLPQCRLKEVLETSKCDADDYIRDVCTKEALVFLVCSFKHCWYEGADQKCRNTEFSRKDFM